MRSTKTLLWLDDQRDPHLPPWKGWHNTPEGTKVYWVKNYLEFTNAIYDNPWWDYISFDHDLATEHYTPEKYWTNYQASKAHQDKMRPTYISRTGEDCARWFVNFYKTQGFRLPKFFVHSQNPVGRDRILEILTDYLREQAGFPKAV